MEYFNPGSTAAKMLNQLRAMPVTNSRCFLNFGTPIGVELKGEPKDVVPINSCITDSRLFMLQLGFQAVKKNA